MASRPRTDLQIILEGFAPNVYFQPPNDVLMEYPAIVYKRDGVNAEHANNNPYILGVRYLITAIGKDPDELLTIVLQIASMESAVHQRNYVVRNLYHEIFLVYF